MSSVLSGVFIVKAVYLPLVHSHVIRQALTGGGCEGDATQTRLLISLHRRKCFICVAPFVDRSS